MTLPRTVVWEPIDGTLRGHDLVRVAPTADGVCAEGAVVAVGEDGPWAVRFTVVLDAAWTTREVTVESVSPGGLRRLVLEGDGGGGWRADGRPAPALDGCLDVDLEATPFTNTLPIRRLGLAAGEAAEIRAAWVSAPALEVRVAAQVYERVSGERWRYRSLTTGFEAGLLVDDEGLVVAYERAARRVATA
jgi:hypothetical protein